MPLPIIQSLWIGAPLSNLEKLCVQSFLDHGHQFHLYTYGDVQGIPNGATIKDGNEIVPLARIREYPKPPWASAYFRYALLEQRGGWWVDTDVICIKPFDFSDEIVLGLGNLGIPMSVLKFPAGHKLMTAMRKACIDHAASCPWDDPDDKFRKQVEAKRGRRHFTTPYLHKAVFYYGLEPHAKPTMYFYSMHHHNYQPFFDETYANRKPHPDVHSMHVSWDKRSGMDINAVFPAKSLFQQLKAKHNIAEVTGALVYQNAPLQKLIYPNVFGVRERKRRQLLWYGCLLLAIGFTLGILVSTLL